MFKAISATVALLVACGAVNASPSQIPFTVSPTSVSGSPSQPYAPGDFFTITVTLASPLPFGHNDAFCGTINPFSAAGTNPLYGNSTKELFYGAGGGNGLFVNSVTSGGGIASQMTTVTLKARISECVPGGPGGSGTLYILPYQGNGSHDSGNAGSQATGNPAQRDIADTVISVPVSWSK